MTIQQIIAENSKQKERMLKKNKLLMGGLIAAMMFNLFSTAINLATENYMNLFMNSIGISLCCIAMAVNRRSRRNIISTYASMEETYSRIERINRYHETP